MSYKVEYSKRALKQLKKMDKFDSLAILSWVDKHLNGIKNPRLLGKALSGDYAGEWRYRVGNYRLLCLIRDDIITIEILAIGHRRDVYKKHN